MSSELAQRLAQGFKAVELKQAYDAGFDAGKNRPTNFNCRVGCFATKELSREWERGNDDGKKAKDIIKTP